MLFWGKLFQLGRGEDSFRWLLPIAIAPATDVTTGAANDRLHLLAG